MPLAKLESPKPLLSRIKGLIKGLVSALCLFLSLIIINILQMLSVGLMPISKKAFRSINRFFADSWWGACDLWAEKWWDIKIIFTGDEIPEKENVILVSNHQQMTDITALFRLARQKKRLGDLKWFVKDVLKYVPGIGWGMLFLDCLFLKRDWSSDKSYIDKTFRKFIDEEIPIWTISFVEGTRVTEKKISKSQEYAEKAGLKKLKHVLIPRTKGFVATVLGLKDHIDAIYDVTIGYEKGVSNLWQWCEGYVRKVHIDVRRFSKSELPSDEKELDLWLKQRFAEKDKLLEKFYKTGSF